jgi:hypothetical protein
VGSGWRDGLGGKGYGGKAAARRRTPKKAELRLGKLLAGRGGITGAGNDAGLKAAATDARREVTRAMTGQHIGFTLAVGPWRKKWRRRS